MACKFSGHIHCSDTDPKRLNGCQHCGWNPEVVQKRKAHKKAAPDGANIEDGRPEGQQSSTPSV